MSSDAPAAESALKSAKVHLSNSNYESATRLAQKALRMDSSRKREIESLLSQIETAKLNPSLRNRASTSSPQASTSKTELPQPEKRAFTSDQAAVVKRIRTCQKTAYYEILAVEKSCDDAAIKKAYKKHSLSVHPDKNGAPGADEAFKMVSTAFQVLSDGDKRAHYDRYGGDVDDRRSGFSNPGFATSPTQFRGGEVSPEDLFNMFFGNGQMQGGPFGMGGNMRTFTFGPGMNMHQRGAAARGAQHANGQQQNSPVWLQLLPLIILFAMSILSQLPSLFTTPPPPDPTYVYEVTPKHNLRRTTQNLKLDYWISPPEFKRSAVFTQLREANPAIAEQLDALDETNAHFKPLEKQVGVPSAEWKATSDRIKYPRGFLDFESRVENIRVNHLKVRCENELDVQMRQIQQYSGAFGFIGRDEDKIRQVSKRVLANCDALQKLGYVVHRNYR